MEEKVVQTGDHMGYVNGQNLTFELKRIKLYISGKPSCESIFQKVVVPGKRFCLKGTFIVYLEHEGNEISEL